MPPLLLTLVFDRMAKGPAPFFVKPIVRGIANNVLTTFVMPQLEQHVGYIEGELAKSEWFAGDEFTAADIQMSFPLEAAAPRAAQPPSAAASALRRSPRRPPRCLDTQAA